MALNRFVLSHVTRPTTISHSNRLNEMSLTFKQVEALNIWETFSLVKGYSPTQVELAELIGVAGTVVTRWFSQWEQLGLIVRGKGLRNHRMTGKASNAIRDYFELNDLYTQYQRKREEVVERYST